MFSVKVADDFSTLLLGLAKESDKGINEFFIPLATFNRDFLSNEPIGLMSASGRSRGGSFRGARGVYCARHRSPFA